MVNDAAEIEDQRYPDTTQQGKQSE